MDSAKHKTQKGVVAWIKRTAGENLVQSQEVGRVVDALMLREGGWKSALKNKFSVFSCPEIVAVGSAEVLNSEGGEIFSMIEEAMFPRGWSRLLLPFLPPCFSSFLSWPRGGGTVSIGAQ